MSNAYDRLVETPEGRRELCIEQTITNVTELICKHLEESQMTRSDLARAMEVSPGRITQLLDGDANLTLRSVARALAAFDHILLVSSEPLTQPIHETDWMCRSTMPLSNMHSPRTEGFVEGVFEPIVLAAR